MNNKPTAKKVAAKKKPTPKKKTAAKRVTRPTSTAKQRADNLSRRQVMAMLSVTTVRRIAQLQTRADRPLPFIRKGNSCEYDPRRFYEWLAEEVVAERVGAAPVSNGDKPAELIDKRQLETARLQEEVRRLRLTNSREEIALAKDQGTSGPILMMVQVLSAAATEMLPIVESLPGELQKSLEVEPSVITFVTDRVTKMMNTISDLAEGNIERFIALSDMDDD